MVTSHEPTVLAAILLALLTLAIALERTRVGKFLPGPSLMLGGAALLSNFGLVPHSAPTYDAIARVAVPMGVFILLLRANMRQIFRETGAALALYLVGGVASVLGILIAWRLAPPIDAAKMAAVQTANLVGGTVNVVAVARATHLEPTHFSAMVAASALLISSYMAVAGVLARWPWFRGKFPSRGDAPARAADVEASTASARRPVNALDLALILSAAFVAFAVSEQLLDRAGHKDLLILAVTVLALLAANLLPRGIAGLSGDRELGTLMMYAYFGTLGFGVNVTEFGQAAVGIMVFTILAMAVHLAIILLAGRLLRADLDEILVASIAGIGGPTTAAAMAASFGRRNLIAPGILCGLLGFAIATFVGLGVYLVLPH